jgi:hypothetical protein
LKGSLLSYKGTNSGLESVTDLSSVVNSKAESLAVSASDETEQEAVKRFGPPPSIELVEELLSNRGSQASGPRVLSSSNDIAEQAAIKQYGTPPSFEILQDLVSKGGNQTPGSAVVPSFSVIQLTRFLANLFIFILH